MPDKEAVFAQAALALAGKTNQYGAMSSPGSGWVFLTCTALHHSDTDLIVGPGTCLTALNQDTTEAFKS